MIDTLNKEAEALRLKLREIEQKIQDEQFSKLLIEEKAVLSFTVDLHNACCQWNHCDGCSWGYEEQGGHQWNAWAHNHWLGKARELITKFGFEKAKNFVSAYKQIKTVMPEFGQIFYQFRA